MEKRIIGDPSVFAVVYAPEFINDPRTLITGPCYLMINNINFGPMDEIVYYLSMVEDELRWLGRMPREVEEIPAGLNTKRRVSAYFENVSDARQLFGLPGWMEYFTGIYFKQGDDLVFYWYLESYVVKRKRFAGYPKGVQRAVVPIDAIKAVSEEFSRQLKVVLETQENSEEMKRKYIDGYGEPAGDA